MTKTIYDTIILGAGPAGLSAGLYAGRATMSTLIIEADQVGGQVTTTSVVWNYPAVEEIDGPALVHQMKQQAESFGVTITKDNVTSVDFSDDVKILHGQDQDYYAYSVIVATGAQPRQIGFTGEQEYRGRGVAYCSTCDGELFRDLDVFVIGGGYAAAEEADYLTRFAKHVTVVMRGDGFTCAPLTAQRALDNPKVSLWTNTEIQSVSGDNVITEATFINNQTGETTTHHVAAGDSTFGVFVYVGTVPQTKLLGDAVALTDDGYIIADRTQATNVPGVYAAGDVIDKALRQIVTAASDGANAATAAEIYVTDYKAEHNIPVTRVATKPKSETPKETPAPKAQPAAATGAHTWFSAEIRQQLAPILDKITQPVILKHVTDQQAKSQELASFVAEFATLSAQFSVETVTASADTSERLPSLQLLAGDHTATGISFTGIPTGHELNSLILAVYNVGGPGQAVDDTLRQRIQALPAEHLTVGISLTCHFCPDVVAACQRIASLNPAISAEMIDLQLFPEIRTERAIMSVPAILFDDDVVFGSQSLEDIVTILEKRA